MATAKSRTSAEPRRPWWDPFGELRGWFSREEPLTLGATRGQIELAPGWCDPTPPSLFGKHPPRQFAIREEHFEPTWRWDFCGHETRDDHYFADPVHRGVKGCPQEPLEFRRELSHAPLEAEMPLVPAVGETPGLYGPFKLQRRHGPSGFDEVWILADLEPVVRSVHARRRAWVEHRNKPFDPEPILAFDECYSRLGGGGTWDSRLKGSRFLLSDEVRELPPRFYIIPSRLDAETGQRVWDAYSMATSGVNEGHRRYWARYARRGSLLGAPFTWAASKLGLRNDFLLDILLGQGRVLARMRADVRDLVDRYERAWLPQDLEPLRAWIKSMRDGGWAQAIAARLAYAERRELPVVFDPALANEGRVHDLLGGDRWMAPRPDNRWFLQKELHLDEDLVPGRGPKVLEDLWRKFANRELTTRPDQIAAALWYHNYQVRKAQQGMTGLLRRKTGKEISWDDQASYLETSSFGTLRLASHLTEAWAKEPHPERYGPRVPESLRRSFLQNFLAGTWLDLQNARRWYMWSPFMVVRLPLQTFIRSCQHGMISDGLYHLPTVGKYAAVSLAVLLVGTILVLVPTLMLVAR